MREVLGVCKERSTFKITRFDALFGIGVSQRDYRSSCFVDRVETFEGTEDGTVARAARVERIAEIIPMDADALTSSFYQ